MKCISAALLYTEIDRGIGRDKYTLSVYKIFAPSKTVLYVRSSAVAGPKIQHSRNLICDQLEAVTCKGLLVCKGLQARFDSHCYKNT